MDGGTPQPGGPYRANAREAEPSRHVAGRRRRARRLAPVFYLLGAPRYAGLVMAGVAALTFGRLNLETRAKDEILTPNVQHVENVVAIGLLLTIPLVTTLLALAWRVLPAPRASKRRHLVRSTKIQVAAVVLALAATVAARPSSARAVASGAGPGGRVGYAYQWEWGCGYRVGVSADGYSVRGLAAIGPLPCDEPPPRVAWRGTEVALVAADGTEIASWPSEANEP